MLAILLAALFVLRTVNRRTEEAETKKAAEQKIYVKRRFPDMTKIRYQSGTDGMTFEKTADQETWIYMEDPDFPLAQQYPEEMENKIPKAGSQAGIERR